MTKDGFSVLMRYSMAPYELQQPRGAYFIDAILERDKPVGKSSSRGLGFCRLPSELSVGCLMSNLLNCVFNG